MSLFRKLFKDEPTPQPAPSSTPVPWEVLEAEYHGLDSDQLAERLLTEGDDSARYWQCAALRKLGSDRISPRALAVLWYRMRLTQREGGVQRAVEPDPGKYSDLLYEFGHGELAMAAIGVAAYEEAIPECWQLLLGSSDEIVVKEALSTLAMKVPYPKRKQHWPKPVIDQLRALASSAETDRSEPARAFLARLADAGAIKR